MAQRAVITLDVEGQEARAELAKVDDSLENVEVSAREASESIERSSQNAASSINKTAQAADRASDALEQQGDAARSAAASTGGLGRSGTGASQLLFSIADGAQDARFGLRGVTNNAAFAAEQFSNLTTRAGSVGGALRAIGGSLLNPTVGLIFGFQLLISFAPEILSFFRDTEEEAKNTKDALEGMRDGVQSVADAFRDLDESQQQNVRQRLERLRSQLRQVGFGNVGPLAGQFTPERAREAANAVDALVAALDVNPKVERFFRQLTDFGLPPDTAQRLAEIAAGVREVKAAAGDREVKAAAGESITAGPARFEAGFGLSVLDVSNRESTSRFPSATAGTAFRPENRTLAGGGPGADPGVNFLQSLDLSSEKAGDALSRIEKQAQQTTASVVSGAASMGSALVRAFKRGEATFQSVASTILQGLGGILSVIPGVGPVAGVVTSGLGNIIGSFAEGGTTRTPLAVVGERGPEVIAPPRGSRVVSNGEVTQALRSAGGQDRVVQAIDRLATRMSRMEVVMDSTRVRAGVGRSRSEAVDRGVIEPTR